MTLARALDLFSTGMLIGVIIGAIRAYLIIHNDL